MPGVLTTRRVLVVSALTLVLVALLLSRQSHESTVLGAASPPKSPIYGRCHSEQLGDIKGDVTQKGREGSYAISSLTEGSSSPFDESTGQVRGVRQHRPLAFTTDVSRATPLFIRTHANNEVLDTCVFKFWTPVVTSGGAAQEKQYFTIELRDAHVVSYNLSGKPGGNDHVTYSLTYGEISYTITTGGITFQDTYGPDNS